MESAAFLGTLKGILEKLEITGIPYMIVGSVASIIYGEPRMTKDIDIVIDILPQDAKKFGNLFPFQEFYCPPEEILIPEITARGYFNLVHHLSGLKIDIIVRQATPHALLEFSRRQKVSFWQDFEAYVASPEDVIIKKLDYFREGGSEKHLSDIRGILANTEVNISYLEDWCQKLGLMDQWKKAQGCEPA